MYVPQYYGKYIRNFFLRYFHTYINEILSGDSSLNNFFSKSSKKHLKKAFHLTGHILA